MLKDPNDSPGDGAPGSSLSRSLLLRLRARDGDAWHVLARLYGPVVYDWCRRQGMRHDDAEDVGQEVFAAVARGIGDFRRDGEGHTFRGWLWGIASHKMADFWRKRGGQPVAAGGSDARQRLEQVPADGSSTASGVLTPDESALLLRRAVDLVRLGFEETTWQAFHRVVVEGKAPADVARELGLSVGAVYVAKSKVLRRLREEFGGLTD